MFMAARKISPFHRAVTVEKLSFKHGGWTNAITQVKSVGFCVYAKEKKSSRLRGRWEGGAETKKKRTKREK